MVDIMFLKFLTKSYHFIIIFLKIYYITHFVIISIVSYKDDINNLNKV